MNNRPHENSVALGLAVTLPWLAGLWLISGPQAASPSVSTATALLVALVGTAVTLYKNSQGTGSIGQPLHALMSAGSRPVSGSATRSGS